MSQEPKEIAALTPPKWLSKAEKFAFHRLVAQREAAGIPVSATETDTIADLISLRSRIGDMRKIYRIAREQARSCPSNLADRASFLAAARQLDAMVSNAQRQARRLSLGPAD